MWAVWLFQDAAPFCLQIHGTTLQPGYLILFFYYFYLLFHLQTLHFLTFPPLLAPLPHVASHCTFTTRHLCCVISCLCHAPLLSHCCHTPCAMCYLCCVPLHHMLCIISPPFIMCIALSPFITCITSPPFTHHTLPELCSLSKLDLGWKWRG